MRKKTKKEIAEEEKTGLRMCTGCDEILNLNADNFYKKGGSRIGFRPSCKKCCTKDNLNRYRNLTSDELKHKREILKKWRKNNPDKVKIKRLANYQKHKEKMDARCKVYREANRSEINRRKRQYYEKNRESILGDKRRIDYYKQYRKRPEVKRRKKEWAKQPKVKKKVRERCAERYASDPNYRLRVLVRTSINKMLKGRKLRVSCWGFLPYSLSEFKRHIESQFESWMNWNNYGVYNPTTYDQNPTWNIDHLIPQSNLPYDSMDHPNFKKCWALENLRPYSAKQNLLDGVRRIRHK